MKKWLSSILILLLCFTFTACELEDEEDEDDDRTRKPKFTTEQATQTPDATPTVQITQAVTEAPTQNQSEDNVLSNDDFTITFPGTWQYQAPQNAVENEVMLYVYYPNSRSNINFIWNSDTTLKVEAFNEETAKLYIEAIQQSIQTEVTYEGINTVTLGNKNGAVLYYSLTVDGSEVGGMQVYVPVADGTYIITATLFNQNDTNPILEVVQNIKFK